jgi:hypothetical protein
MRSAKTGFLRPVPGLPPAPARRGTPFAISSIEHLKDFNNLAHLEDLMLPLAEMYSLAAIGYSLIYLLFGGGLGGAVLIFIVAKMFGQ